MPCYSEPPSHREYEERRLNGLLDEIDDPRPRQHGGSNSFGPMRAITLDEATQTLCAWCRTHDVSTRSLELQIWWRDHRAWDARRVEQEKADAEAARVRAEAASKLTDAERKALGLA